MRVIGGEFRSRRLVAPGGTATRPTSDRLRETLFNVLGPRVVRARFADLYAGSGAVGIEALSRGAAFCHFAENAPSASKVLRANLGGLRILSGFAVEERGTAVLLERLAREGGEPLDVVFLDPPYEAAPEYHRTLETLARHRDTLLSPHAVIAAEHRRRQALPESVGALLRIRVLEQGDAALSFFSQGSE